MTQGKVVVSGTVEASYAVLEYEMDNGRLMYDVFLSNGHESMELFDTVEEAESYALQRLGG